MSAFPDWRSALHPSSDVRTKATVGPTLTPCGHSLLLERGWLMELAALGEASFCRTGTPTKLDCQHLGSSN
jgi:hypothetical protein